MQSLLYDPAAVIWMVFNETTLTFLRQRGPAKVSDESNNKSHMKKIT